MDKLKKLLESTLVKDFKIIKEETYILNEGIEEIKKYYPKIDDNMIKTLVALDPTFKGGNNLGKYGKWILNLYNKGLLKDEDFYKVTEYLTTFTNNLSKMPNKDIMTYKSLPDLAKAIQGLEGQKDISKKQQVRDIKKGAKKVMETKNWLVISPTTKEAACYYGANTKWCTAAKEFNQFDDYNDRGPLYIFINKEDNTKFQFHAETFQFMNELDESVAPKKVINDEEVIKFIEDKCVDATYDDNYDIWDDSILQGLYQDEWEGLYMETNIHDFFDSIFSESDDILRQAVNIVENYYMGEIVNYLRLYDEDDVTFNSTIKKLFKLYLDNRKLNLQHINTMKYYGFDYIGNDELKEYINKIDALKDDDVRIYELFGEIESEIIHQLNQHLNFFKVKNIDYEDDYIKIYVDTIYNSETIQDANIDWFMNVNETLYRDNIFEEIANKIETPKTNNEIIAEMLIHGIIKIIKENNEEMNVEEKIKESFSKIKNPSNELIETYLKYTSLKFAFNPMNNDFIICKDTDYPIALTESKDNYIIGILSPNMIEVSSKISENNDIKESREIVESLLGNRLKKIFKNHYEIIIY